MSRSYRRHYSRALDADPERLHFAGHSHHPWPDASRNAQLEYWDDSARLLDEKWDYLFSEVFPTAQGHIASVIGTDNPEQICIGANVHDFLVRILSCFEPGAPLRVLTTDSEFHSFERQISRLEELDTVTVTRIPVEPYESFQERFEAAARAGGYELVYVSHVFFNSGLHVPDLDALVKAVPDDAVVVIDGYHAFCAVPFDLSAVADRVFYTAGGYKYAQSGEGMCFLHVPPGCQLRPLDTGWFAAFSALSEPDAGATRYSNDGWRFAGATLDPGGTYRFNAVMLWWEELSITVADVHDHVQSLKRLFLERLDAAELRTLRRADLILPGDQLNEGHFLTFRISEAASLRERLAGERIITDSRADRLRFGFGLYQDEAMVEALFDRLTAKGF